MERNVHKHKSLARNERNASHNSRRNVLLRELFTKANIMLISPTQSAQRPRITATAARWGRDAVMSTH